MNGWWYGVLFTLSLLAVQSGNYITYKCKVYLLKDGKMGIFIVVVNVIT